MKQAVVVFGELPGGVADFVGVFLHILHDAFERVLLSAHLVALPYGPGFRDCKPEREVCGYGNPESRPCGRHREEQEDDYGYQAEQQGVLVEVGGDSGAYASENLVIRVAVEFPFIFVPAVLSACGAAIGRFVRAGVLVRVNVFHRTQGVAGLSDHGGRDHAGRSAFLEQQLRDAHFDFLHYLLP